MMTLLLNRYLGGSSITKSYLKVQLDGKEILAFEARELAYRDYTEKFAGSTHYCIPCGTFKMKARSTKYGLMTLRTQRMPCHSDVAIGWDMFGDANENAIIIGMSDGNPDPMMRGIVESRRAFDLLTNYVYQTFGQDVMLIVTNENVLTEEEYWKQVADNQEFSMEK